MLRSSTLLAALISGAAAQKGQGADGNPHGWDRRRRCDGSQYTPVCGVCEGYGGIPFGDKNEDITLSKCTPAAAPASRKLVRPIWSTRMTMSPYYAVQIGPKKDPFCFQAIPENQSNGELCYQPQTGSQVYEMGEFNVLRFDVNLATGAGNVTSSVYARDQYLWIVNHLPWYALGVKQCICTEPKEGGDASKGFVYPLQYNWTNRMSHIGLEHILVEYVWKNMTLDHWTYGPHHVWTVPETGSIIRMWQPFNGLQVMPNGTLASSIDPAHFKPIPPTECTSESHFTFKIKCNDSGYPAAPPAPPAAAEAAAWAETRVETPALPPVPGKEDEHMWRAKQVVPRHGYKGESFEHMSEVLNGWIVQATGHERSKPCAEWDAAELQKLQAMLYMLRFPAYDDVYRAADDKRAILGSMETLMSDWAKLNAAAEETGLSSMHRDGHCHEAVMWYTHHLQEDAKKLLNAKGVVLPLLSTSRHECDAPPTDKHAAVCASYDYKVSCSDCHANVRPGKAKLGFAASARRLRSLLGF